MEAKTLNTLVLSRSIDMEIYERVEAVQHKVQDLTMQIEFYMRELDEIKQELMKSDLLVPGWIKERLKEERDV